jgi:hypothetical protein
LACSTCSLNRSRALAVAIAQPSAELAANSVTMASEHGRPSSSLSMAPSSLATLGQPARPSTRLSSTSGLVPHDIRRNTFRMARVSKMTLVLLCSASTTQVAVSTGRSTSGSGTKRRLPTVAPASMSPISSRALASS